MDDIAVGQPYLLEHPAVHLENQILDSCWVVAAVLHGLHDLAMPEPCRSAVATRGNSVENLDGVVEGRVDQEVSHDGQVVNTDCTLHEVGIGHILDSVSIAAVEARSETDCPIANPLEEEDAEAWDDLHLGYVNERVEVFDRSELEDIDPSFASERMLKSLRCC